MNANPASQQYPADAGSLATSLDETDRLLKNCTSRTRNGNVLTILVGVVLLGLLGGYFVYGYNQISSVMEPDTLVDVAQSWLDNQIPEVRRSLEAEVDRSAPVWAESLSKQAQSSLPSIREKLEDYVLEQVDQTVEQSMSITEDNFRKFLREKREVLDEGFKDLATSPQLAKESLARLELAMNDAMEADMKQGASDLYTTLTLMNVKLARLKAGQHLTTEEALERQVLMQIRRLQLEEIGADKGDAGGAQADIILPVP